MPTKTEILTSERPEPPNDADPALVRTSAITPGELYLSDYAKGELRTIPIEELYESPWNPRQHYPENALAELVESMKTSGFREWLPLMVRPIGDDSEIWRKIGGGGYEIGAGHRRRRAAELAGVKLIPCVVRPMNDEQFLDVLNFDNSGREDVHPLHEAAGWRQWMEKTGKGVLDIAARIGQSKEYVYQRLKYSDLIADAQAAFLDGKITAGHAILIARRDGKEQAKRLKYCLTPVNYSGALPSVRMLAEALHRDAYIDLRDNDLRDNCFDRTDKTLLSGAGDCDSCPKRAANIPGFEFEEDNSGADVCTDRVCHQQKIDNHLYRIKTDIYAKEGHFPLHVSEHWSTKKKGVLAQTDWDLAPANDKTAKTALVFEGQNIGKTIKVRLKNKATPAASPQETKQQTKVEVERQRAEQKAKEERELAIRRQILLAVRAKVGGLMRGDIEALLLEMVRDAESTDELCKLHGIAFKEHQSYEAFCQALPNLKEPEVFQLAVEVTVIHELEGWPWNRPATALLALAKRYKVDAAKIRKEAEEAAKATEVGQREVPKPSTPAPPKKTAAKPAAKTLTPAIPKKIADKQKERWAKFKKSQRAKIAKPKTESAK
jgi:ParB family transcriptional regulator, chromosome partitioning protein